MFILQMILFILFTVALITVPKNEWKSRHNTLMMTIFLIGAGLIFVW